MHYKNGREAKIGDKIYYRDYQGMIKPGIVVDQCSGATSCNLTVVAMHEKNTVTASECLRQDDLQFVGTPAHVESGEKEVSTS